MNRTKDTDWKVAIHESKQGERIVAFAREGHNMSKRWWNQTYKLDQNNDLWGVYRTSSGLRRTLKGLQ